MEEKKNRYKGILFIIMSAFCFALMNAFVRMAGRLAIDTEKFLSKSGSFIFRADIIEKGRRRVFGKKKENIKYLLIRSGAGTIGILCNYYAVDYLILSDASMLNKMSPFFVIIFSIFVLKKNQPETTEHCHWSIFRKSLDLKTGWNQSGLCSGSDRTVWRNGGRTCLYLCQSAGRAWRKR